MDTQQKIIDIIRRIKGQMALFYSIDPDEILTSNLMQMSEIDVVYLFLELQNVFGIDLAKLNYDFEHISTVNEIAKQVEKLMISC